MLTVLASGKASPGTTTAAMAMALRWPAPVMLVDADIAGGDVAAGIWGGTIRVDLGLLTWTTAARRAPDALTASRLFLEHAVAIPDQPHLCFLPGLSSASQSLNLTPDIWTKLASSLQSAPASLGRDVIVDAGRVVGDRAPWPVLAAADRILLPVRPTMRSVHAASDAAERLSRELGDLNRVELLLTGSGPYSASEVSGFLSRRIAGVIPEDRNTAHALTDNSPITDRALTKSPLMRAAGAVASRLATSIPAYVESGAAK